MVCCDGDGDGTRLTVLDTFSYLRHLVSYILDDRLDILSKRNSLRDQINYVFRYSNKCDPLVKVL